VRCTVDIGDLAKGYTAGGQYLQLKIGNSKPGFFAIASAPSSKSTIELLVKNQGSTAELLCDSKAGLLPTSSSARSYPLNQRHVPYLCRDSGSDVVSE
jgi:hypothetical protein